MLLVDQIKIPLQKAFPELAVFCFSELQSTSGYLKRYAQSHLSPAFCLALSQTSGYGQQSRVWKSDCSSLTFSSLLHLETPLHQIDGFTQLIALKLIESLSEYSDQSFKIKWPNDIYVDHKKAGGILVECVAYSETDCWLVVGIGLNNGLKEWIQDALTERAVVPNSIELGEENKIKFLMDVINRQLVLAKGFEIGYFKRYLVNYNLVDYFNAGESVIVYDKATKKSGFYKGLTDNGELLVTLEGQLCQFRSEAISIRPMEHNND